MDLDSPVCAAHSSRAAERTCPRCGAFCCDDCLEATGADRCRACAALVRLSRPREAAWGLGLAVVASSPWLVVTTSPFFFFVGQFLLVPVAAAAAVLSLIALGRSRSGRALSACRGVIPLALGLAGVQCFLGGMMWLALPVKVLMDLHFGR